MLRRFVVALVGCLVGCGPLTGEEELELAQQTQSVISTKQVILHWNIAHSMGVASSNGTSCAYTAGTSSCSTNAWGNGNGPVVTTLRGLVVNDYPNTLAVSLNEAESCASGAAYKTALGWVDSHQSGSNAIVAKYGFVAGSKASKTLTTCGDGYTRTVLRGLVCANAACTSSVQLFVTHLGWTTTAQPTCNQAAEVVAYMNTFSGNKVLSGDLNADPGHVRIAAIPAAGYVDAWKVYGDGTGGVGGESRTGYTGTWNNPAKNGGMQYPTRRIDYFWLKGYTAFYTYQFNTSGTIGSCRPSDHSGLILQLN